MISENTLGGPSPRSLYKAVMEIVRDDPVLAPAFAKFRVDARNLTRPLDMDLTSKCNLFCEGCYYFEGDNQSMVDEEDNKVWEDFFQHQNKLGIQYCYLGGAEPALYPERIKLAAKNIPRGVIAANGTVKIDKSIPYRIAVSVWGDEELTSRLRGGNTFWKAIRNYGNDERALFAYTLTRENLDQVRGVAEIMRDAGAKLTFNMYSPTTSYLDKIQSGAAHDDQFFRVSTKEDNLCFQPDDLIKCREIIAQIIDDFPETVVYPHAYNREVTENSSLYTLEPDTGFASNCAGRHNGTHTTYLSTLKQSSAKCCMPNIDCADCRALASYLPSRLMPRPKDIVDRESVKDWLEIGHYWAWFYLREEWKPLLTCAPKTPPE